MNLSSQVWYDKIGWEAFLIELNPSPIHRVNEVGITNKVPWWWNERKCLEIQCERAKNYFWERGIQLGSGGKKKEKRKTVRFMQVSYGNQEDPTSCLCWRPQKLLTEKLQSNQGNFWFLKFSMLGCTTSVTFQSFRCAFTCCLAKPSLSFLLLSFNRSCFLSDS